MAGNWSADAVGEWLAGYADAWRSNRAERISEHWLAERFVLYKAEEVERIMTGWDEVVAYWQANEGLHEAIALRFRDLTATALGAGLCAAGARMRWDIRFADDARGPDGVPFAHRGKAMGGENHVVMLLASNDDGPRLVAWVEAPDAPLAYLRRLYLEAADPAMLA